MNLSPVQYSAHSRTSWVCSALLVAVLPPQVYAQEQPGVVTLQRIEISGSSSSRNTNDLVSLQTVVGRAEIERLGDAQLTDVLRRLPGVTIDNPSGRSPEVRLRGMGSGYVRVTINGESTAPGFTIDGLAASQIERIEIQRSASAEASGQSIGGTINIVLKSAAAAATATERSIQASLSQQGSRPALAIDANLSSSDGDWRRTLNASIQRDLTSSRTRSVQTEIDNGTEASKSMLDQTQFGYSKTSNLGGGLHYKGPNEATWGIDAHLRRRAIDGSTREGRTYDAMYSSQRLDADDVGFDFSTTSIQLKSKAKYRFDGGSKLEANLSLGGNRKQTAATVLGFGQNGVPVMSHHSVQRASARTSNFSGKYSATLTDEDSFSAGWDFDDSRNTNRQEQVNDIAFQGLYGLVSDSYSADIQNLAVFVQHEHVWAPELSSYAGIRWAALRTDTRGASLEPVLQNQAAVSPVLKGTWKPEFFNETTLVGALSRTFKAPASVDLIPRRQVTSINGPLTADVQGNPELKSELAWGLDLSAETKLGSVGSASMGFFWRDIDDVILREQFVEGGRWVERKINSGKASVFGLEFDTRFQVKKWLKSAPNISATAYVGLNRSRLSDVKTGERQLDLQSPVQVKLSWEHKLSGSVLPGVNDLKWGGQLQYMGSSRTRRSDAVENLQGAQTTLDLYAACQPMPNSTLKVVINNLFGTDRARGLNASFDGVLLQERALERQQPAIKIVWRTSFR